MSRTFSARPHLEGCPSCRVRPPRARASTCYATSSRACSIESECRRTPAGTRTAVNLGGLAVEDLRRGQVLGAPGTLKPTRALDARLRLIRDARPLRHNAEVSFHTGAAETLGKLSLLDRDELQPGDEA